MELQTCKTSGEAVSDHFADVNKMIEFPICEEPEVNAPTIEKILVDMVGDIEFSFLQGSEINHVYNTIFERHSVNKNKLLRYAARRGRKEEVQELLKINQL